MYMTCEFIREELQGSLNYVYVLVPSFRVFKLQYTDTKQCGKLPDVRFVRTSQHVYVS